MDGLGLSVNRGPVVVASYEDSPPRMRDRAIELLEAPDVSAIPQPLYVFDMSSRPLFGPTLAVPFYDAVPGRLASWSPFWRRVASRIREGRQLCPGPGLVVIDPAQEAFVGDETRPTAVRHFLDSACAVCRTLGTGLVVIAHPSKLGLTRIGARGAEAISGTAAWHDAARGVLSLRREADLWRLRAEKANYGPSKVDVYLTRDAESPFRVRPAPDEQVSVTQKPEAPKPDRCGRIAEGGRPDRNRRRSPRTVALRTRGALRRRGTTRSSAGRAVTPSASRGYSNA